MMDMMDGEKDDAGSTADPLDFHHPYTPYEVQIQFMKTVYDVLSRGDGQVGILESPTGTGRIHDAQGKRKKILTLIQGKSLSLICGALTWLRNQKKSQFEASIGAVTTEFKDEPEWIVNQMLGRKRDELAKKWQEREQRLERIRAKERMVEERIVKKRRLEEPTSRGKRLDVDEEMEFLLDDGPGGDGNADDDPLASFSKETRKLMEKVGLASRRVSDEEEEPESEQELKIIYTSRTHSQLTQFISELRRPAFPPSLTSATASNGESEVNQEGVKHVPLSSRQKLCINPSVARLASLPAINDRCAELQKPKSKDKCSFLPNTDNLSETHQFRDTALATLPDIEDLYRVGKTLHVCPYYASRTAIPGAEIITLPYPLLLQRSAREALGIKLEENVVIIDEAHNIMDAVANVNAAGIRLSELRRVRAMLGVYVKRFGKKLKGENRVMIGRLGRVIDGLAEWMDGALSAKGDQGIVDSTELLKHKGMDQINLFDLTKYVQESKLAFKVESYAAHIEEQENLNTQKSSTPVLHTLVSFLSALTNLSDEGRIFFEKFAPPISDITLSYLLLSPTHAFSSIASSARAVILAGGTMSPFEDYKAHLFPNHSPDKITTLSCGHVIPPSNLCVWTLAASRPGQSNPADLFEFSFQKRGDHAMMRQLGLALLNICSVVPDGVVIFFPSYGYLDQVIAAWQQPGPKENPIPIWERLQGKKSVFREPKGGSSDEVLQAYTAAILGDENTSSPTQKPAPGPGPRGALLLSVVGGKMSEGINFSDRLGRCVIIVGLPYPNINSPEWKARLEYIEAAALRRGDFTSTPTSHATSAAAAKQAARDFYENACMRAVNQSIGRAIRHRGDYAAIVLVDRRFGTGRIRGKLPGWIQGGLVAGSEERGVQGLMGALNGFFRGKKVGVDKS